jgi:serine/threonine protein kinase
MEEKFGIEKVDISTFSIPLECIPRQRVDGLLKNRDGTNRARFEYGKIIDNGEYGLIQQCVRHSLSKVEAPRTVIVKRPRHIELSLTSEAILQALCHSVIQKFGFHNSVPDVYDIFMFGNEVRFSMEYVEGLNYVEFLKRNPGEQVFMNLLLQLAFILYALETELGFDHRDLNAENIWIRTRSEPQIYSLEIDGVNYTLSITNQLVLLDFGFGCLGNTLTRRSHLSLGNVIPAIDPCPKDGRDMYHILNRLLSNPFIVGMLSETLVSKLRQLMKPYKVEGPYLTHIFTSKPSFSIPALRPKEFIRLFGV